MSHAAFKCLLCDYTSSDERLVPKIQPTAAEDCRFCACCAFDAALSHANAEGISVEEWVEQRQASRARAALIRSDA